MATTGNTVLWQTPSGRYHWMRECSGGATRRNTVKVTISDATLANWEWGGGDSSLCRCALGARDKARARLEAPQ